MQIYVCVWKYLCGIATKESVFITRILWNSTIFLDFLDRFSKFSICVKMFSFILIICWYKSSMKNWKKSREIQNSCYSSYRKLLCESLFTQTTKALYKINSTRILTDSFRYVLRVSNNFTFRIGSVYILYIFRRWEFQNFRGRQN